MIESTIPFSLDWWTLIFGGVATLAIYSFLYKENPVYRFFEHIYIGIAAGWGIVVVLKNFLWPKVLKPIFGLDLIVYPDGTLQEPYSYWNLLYLAPMAFGLLYYFILSKRHAWIAQIVIGFQLGYVGGLAFKGTFIEMLPQIFDSFRPLWVPIAMSGSLIDSLQDTATNLIFLTALISSMTYFFFTFRRTPGGAIDNTAHVGRWMMMGCFGAFFGSTIMARMALLVERLNFLIKEWTPALGDAVQSLIAWVGA